VATVKMTYLSAAECAELAEQAFTVLQEVGVIYNTAEALELLAEAGAIVDRETSLVRLPRELVERCLAMAPRQVLLAARDPRNDVLVGGGAPLSITSDGTATYVLDDNTGERRGADVVQLYARDVVGSVTRPSAQLLGYRRVDLEPAESVVVRFTVPTTRLAFADRRMRRIVEPGDVELWVGASCASRETSAALQVTGPAHLVIVPAD